MTVNSIDTLCLATAVVIMSMVAVSIVLLLQKQHAQQQEYFYANPNPVPNPANAPPPALTDGQNVQLEKQKIMDKTHTDKYVTDYTHISNALSKNNKDISSSNVNEKSEKGENSENSEKGETNTLYKDPKDMTPKELALFKKLSNHDNFTVQDYKNWLRLYQTDYYLLSEAHLLNLRNMLRGETLKLSDIPGGIPVISSQQQYYARMYDQLSAARQIHTPATSFATGQQVGYNYNDFGEFSPPLAMPQPNVVNGEIKRTFRPLLKNNGKTKKNNKNNKKNNKMKNKIISIPLEDVQPPFPVSPSM
jgi:hypothetical protein